MEQAVLPHLPLSDIAIFLNVARTGNYTATAKSLYMSQPQVSKRMRNIERELGIQLVEHQGRRVVLTRGGKILYERFAPLYAGMIDAIELAGNDKFASSYTLRIGLAEWDLITYMPQLVQYERNFPGVTIEVGSYSFRELLTGLWGNQIDVVVTTEYGAQSYPRTRFSRMDCGSLPLFAYMSKDDEFAQRESIDISEIKGRKLITPSFETSSSYFELIGKISRMLSYTPEVVMQGSNKGAIAWHIVKDKALYLMSTEYISWGNDSLITRVPIKDFSVGMVALWRKDDNASAMKHLVRHILDPEELGAFADASAAN